jgi:hypothetical protein
MITVKALLKFFLKNAIVIQVTKTAQRCKYFYLHSIRVDFEKHIQGLWTKLIL